MVESYWPWICLDEFGKTTNYSALSVLILVRVDVGRFLTWNHIHAYCN